MTTHASANPATKSPNTPLSNIINEEQWDIANEALQLNCQQQLEADGVLVLPNFLTEQAVHSICEEAITHQNKAFYTQSSHNVFLSPADENYPTDHTRNRQVESSKGCITTDQIPHDSLLHALYDSARFRQFLCAILAENALHEYADNLSSINVHYAAAGQELGWHFDNSSFAITLLIQKPAAGGVFEYKKNLRDSANDDMNLDGVADVLEGRTPVDTLTMDPGCLVLFRGRDSMHRVTPTEGDTTRILVVLAYNSAPDIALSESARMTFYGRLG